MAVRDKCLFCGEPVSITGYCTSCKLKQDHLKKAFNTSIYHYNIALERAKQRDLSGAKEALECSLRYNKQNINSRNLLGLIYYEMGELVLAMNHWVMSMNYKPKNNLATQYLKQIKDDKKFLDDMGQSYIAYNQALEHAKSKDLDLAVLHLRKSLSANKKFVQAYLLLALIYMEKNRKGLAKKALSRVLSIDRQNETAGRYLRELGVATGNLNRFLDANTKSDEISDYYGLENEAEVSTERTPKKIVPVSSDGATRRQMLKRYREKNLARYSNLYVILGIIVGVAVLYLLIVPVTNREKNIEINELRTNYSKDISARNTEIDNLNSENDILSKKIKDYASETDALEEKIQDLEETIETLNTRLSAYDPTGTVDMGDIGKDKTDTTDNPENGTDNPEGTDNTDGNTDQTDTGEDTGENVGDATDDGNVADGVKEEVASNNNQNITGITPGEINTLITNE